MTKATFDESRREKANEEQLIFAEAIDFQPLLDEIQKRAGFTCKFERLELVLSQCGEVWFELESENIVDKAGVMALTLDILRFSTFGSGVSEDKKTGETFFYVNIHFAYQNKSGGRNGSEFFRAHYTDAKGWEFEK